MRFGSVCSGIEAASVAFNQLGWDAAWFSEIEPFPSAVLAHHYPDVTNVGDMTKVADMVRNLEIEAPDMLCGGTPCQAFSVAGLRNSLDDARGNLSLTFCEIANAIDSTRSLHGGQPTIVFWENVPGVLSTKDNAFGCFLAGLAGESDALVAPGGKWTDAGYVSGPQRTIAWRTLDAQYFGLAQRRRRVFVVASAREGFDPAKVLFEFDGVRRDTAPSREARESVAQGVEFDPSGGRFTDVNPTLNTRAKDGPIRNQLAGAALVPAIAQCLTTRTGQRYDPETETILPAFGFAQNQRDEVRVMDVAGALAAEPGAKQQTYIAFSRNDDGSDATEELSLALRVAGNADGMMAVALPINTQIAMRHNQLGESTGFGIGGESDPAFTLTKGHSHAVAYDDPRRFNDPHGGFEHGDIYPTLDAASGLNSTCAQGGTAVATPPAMQVRRLTPTECERLQGFQDGYTNVPYRGKPAADGNRYKALGNSWAVPVVNWIGRRIQAHIGGV